MVAAPCRLAALKSEVNASVQPAAWGLDKDCLPAFSGAPSFADFNSRRAVLNFKAFPS